MIAVTGKPDYFGVTVIDGSSDSVVFTALYGITDIELFRLLIPLCIIPFCVVTTMALIVALLELP